jgi:ATP-dependent RNA helicase RhlE
VTQVVYKVEDDHKQDAVVHLLRGRDLKQVLVFSNTKIGASRLSRHLEQEGIKSSAIHGDKSQAERMTALDAFKNGEVDVLVATDVAARGLDISDLPCVINFDLPYNAEDYVHRIGRTGRAGASGDAISLYSDRDARLLTDIEKMIKHRFVPAELIGFVPATRASAAKENNGERRTRRDEVPGASKNTYPVRSNYVAAPRREKIDPWFLKPYEPEESTSAPSETTSIPKQQKSNIAFLLGGVPKR